MDTIVKYNNQFNQVALRNFSSQELDLLISISSKVREKGTEIIEFSFFELKKYINLKSKHSNVEFMKNIINVNRKLLALNFTFINGNVIEQFTLFNKFKVDGDTQILYVSVNEEFFFLLNQLTSNFTRFELEEFVDFKSTYTKEFYRRMKQFKYTGVWIVSIEEFKNFLDIPQNYKIDTIDKKVFKPIMNELGKEFNLKIIKKYKKTQGRGRSRVSGFEFRFKKSGKKETKKEFREICGNILEKEFKVNNPEKAINYINRKIKMKDKVFERYNYLNIINFKEINEELIVTVKNVDDNHLQNFKFSNFQHFENWFRKYEI